MARTEICDVCGQPTDNIAGKLFYAPMTRANGAKSFHNNYQLHADVGICCEKVLKSKIKWRKRVSAAVYRARGKKDAA